MVDLIRAQLVEHQHTAIPETYQAACMLQLFDASLGVGNFGVSAFCVELHRQPLRPGGKQGHIAWFMLGLLQHASPWGYINMVAPPH